MTIEKNRIKKGDNTNTIARFHCVQCQRFLLKFVANIDMPLVMIPCNNCKKLNLVRQVKGVLEYKTLNERSETEPKGAISDEDIRELMFNCKKETINNE